MTRAEIESIRVGTVLESTHDVKPFTRFKELLPNPRYFAGKKVVKISMVKEDVEGKLFIMGETQFHETSTITFSIKEGEKCYRIAPSNS